MDLLTVHEISRQEKELFTLRDVSFSQKPLQKIAIAGETGSGKTTLLKLIGGLLQPSAGNIYFEQRKVLGPEDQLIPGHAGIAYLSQHFELRNNYWVHEILSYANQLEQESADKLYTICRIDHLLNRRTDQLSGGEKQRIALARLLIGSPRLLLLDEPFSNLDALHNTIIKSVIDDISVRLGISCIMVSHHAPDMLPWADQILILKKGVLQQQGTPEKIYLRPADEYTAGLFGAYNLLEPGAAAKLTTEPIQDAVKKRMLVRPWQIHINKHGAGLQVAIRKILFMGGYYTVEAATDNQLLIITATGNDYEVGETVWLTIAGGEAWYV